MINISFVNQTLNLSEDMIRNLKIEHVILSDWNYSAYIVFNFIGILVLFYVNKILKGDENHKHKEELKKIRYYGTASMTIFNVSMFGLHFLVGPLVNLIGG